MALGTLVPQNHWDIMLQGGSKADPMTESILPEYKEPVEKQQLDLTQMLVQQSQQTQELLQQLLRQNEAVNRTQTQQTELSQGLLSTINLLGQSRQDSGGGQQQQPATPAVPGAVDWAGLIGRPAGQAPTAPQPAQGVTAQQAQEIAQRVQAQAYQQNAQLQQQVNEYNNHFHANFPELMPYYDDIKSRFELEIRANGGNLGQAYNQAVAYGQSLSKNYKPAAPRPAPHPQGGGGYWPGMAGGPGTERQVKVADMMGQVYPIKNYLEGQVPVVDYPLDYEARHLQRYAAAKQAREEVMRGKRPIKALEKYKEFWMADDDEFEAVA